MDDLKATFKLAGFFFGLALLSGCGRPTSRPTGLIDVSVSAMAPLGLGTSSQWTYWVKKDAAVLPESSGTQMCSGSDAGIAYDTCVNAGLTRKVKISSVDSCDRFVSLRDSLSALKWSCVSSSDDSGVWIYSTGFAEGKGISDLVADFSSSKWKSLSLIAETSDTRFTSEATVPWSDTFTAAPDSSSSRASLSTQGALYYMAVDTTGYGFSVDADHVGLVMASNATYTYDSSAPTQPVIVVEEQAFVLLSGRYDAGAQASTGVTMTGTSNSNKYVLINDLVAQNGTYGLMTDYAVENGIFSNIEVRNNSGPGLFVSSSGSAYLIFQHISAHDNAAFGVYIDDSSATHVDLSDVEAYSNTTNGVYLSGISNLTVSNVAVYENDSSGFLSAMITTGTVSGVVAHGNGLHGLDVGNGSNALSLSNITSYDNDTDGIHIGSSPTGVDLDRASAYGNGAVGVNVYGGVQNTDITNLTSTDNGTYGVRIGGGSSTISLASVGIKNSGSVGLAIIDGTNGVDVESVTIESSGTDGVEISNSTASVSVESLRIEGCGENGVMISTGSSADFTNVYINNVVDFLISARSGASATFTGFSFGSSFGGFFETQGSSTIDLKP